MSSVVLRQLRAAALFLALACPAAGGAETAFGPEPPPEEEAMPELTVDDIPLQIAGARVGDWASYTDAEGHLLRLTVVERWTEHGDDHLVIRSTRKRRGKRRETHSEEQVSLKERVADARDLGPRDFLGRSTVLVKGRAVPCVVVNYHDGDQLTRQSYLSADIPVYGLVRGVSIQGNKRAIALKLEDFGFSGEGGTE